MYRDASINILIFFHSDFLPVITVLYHATEFFWALSEKPSAFHSDQPFFHPMIMASSSIISLIGFTAKPLMIESQLDLALWHF